MADAKVNSKITARAVKVLDENGIDLGILRWIAPWLWRKAAAST